VNLPNIDIVIVIDIKNCSRTITNHAKQMNKRYSGTNVLQSDSFDKPNLFLINFTSILISVAFGVN